MRVAQQPATDGREPGTGNRERHPAARSAGVSIMIDSACDRGRVRRGRGGLPGRLLGGLLGRLAGAGLLVFGATACQGPVAGSLEVVPARFAGALLVPVAAGDPVELVRPIQGGHVLFIGAFVRGASGSRGTIRGELRRGEDASGQPLPAGSPGAIIVFEERSTELVELPAGTPAPTAAAGWQQLRADIGDVANIPACPNFLPIEIPDHQLQVQVIYTDEKGNTGTALRTVVPRCTQTQDSARNLCLCECHKNYTIERCFMPADGGTSD